MGKTGGKCMKTFIMSIISIVSLSSLMSYADDCLILDKIKSESKSLKLKKSIQALDNLKQKNYKIVKRSRGKKILMLSQVNKCPEIKITSISSGDYTCPYWVKEYQLSYNDTVLWSVDEYKVMNSLNKFEEKINNQIRQKNIKLGNVPSLSEVDNLQDEISVLNSRILNKRRNYVLKSLTELIPQCNNFSNSDL